MNTLRRLVLLSAPVLIVAGNHVSLSLRTGVLLAKNPPASYLIVTHSGERLAFDCATHRHLPDEFGLVAEAVKASEDRRFDDRVLPVDLIAVARALVSAMKGNSQGASTISMQLARVENPWITYPEKSVGSKGKLAAISRKIVEVGFAYWSEKARGKTGVMRDYLRRVPIPGAGVESTCHRIFGKEPAELTAQEAAAIAALLPAPSRRINNRAEWLAAARRIDPGAIVPKAPAAGWIHPYGSVIACNEPERVIPDLQHDVFMAAHKHLRSYPLEDVSLVVRIEDHIVALVESSKGGVVHPWSFSRNARVRANSVVKIFWADLLLNSGSDCSGLSHALESSNNAYFTEAGCLFGRSRIERRFASAGLKDRSGYSTLGRMWVCPVELLASTSEVVSANPRLEAMLREVPRRGTCAAALQSWPMLPRNTWCKSGTSPGSADYLIVGGRGKTTVLIHAKAKAINSAGAGTVMGPLFADLIKITNQYQKWPSYAHSSK